MISNIFVWIFAFLGCPDFWGQHGSLSDYPPRSKQPQNAKIRSKLIKNMADFWSQFRTIFVRILIFRECLDLKFLLHRGCHDVFEVKAFSKNQNSYKNRVKPRLKMGRVSACIGDLQTRGGEAPLERRHLQYVVFWLSSEINWNFWLQFPLILSVPYMNNCNTSTS